ncbi:MAG: CopD family protein [Pseudomonadota bacterium]
MTYLLIKAFHIIFVVAWMAGLLIYPRYKIHQMESAPGEPLFDTMKEASLRLRRIILTPALIVVWVLGIVMIALNTALLSQGWMHVKLALVIGLSGVHGWLISVGRSIDDGQPKLQAKTLRMVNEVPFLIMIGVVLLAVTKAF